MHRIPVVRFLPEVQIRSAEFLCLTQEEIPTRLKIQMQPLHQRQSLRAGKLGQHIHAEDAVKSPDVDWLRQVHGVEGDQAA